MTSEMLLPDPCPRCGVAPGETHRYVGGPQTGAYCPEWTGVAWTYTIFCVDCMTEGISALPELGLGAWPFAVAADDDICANHAAIREATDDGRRTGPDGIPIGGEKSE